MNEPIPRVESHPFEQRPDESAKAFEAYTVYLNMGAKRSLEAVGRHLGKSKALMERWSKRHNWVMRVDAHGQHWAALTRRAEAKVVHEFALAKAKRQEAQKESEWQLRCEAIDLAREAIFRFKDNAKKCSTLEGIARMMELASKIGRLSCDMATDRTEKTVDEVRTLSVEFKAAIEKIYGEPVPSQFVDVESKTVAPTEVKP